MTQPPPSEQFLALAGLRGVAALIVVQWHGHEFLGGVLLRGGYLAVDFFFLLSGWVLAHAYDRRLEAGMSGPEFLRIRLIRLYPVYVLAVLMMLGGWALGGHSIAPGPLLAFLFLPDFLARPIAWVVRPSWSLAAELAANLPFGFAHRGLTDRVLVAVTGLALASLVCWAWSFGSLDVGNVLATWPGLFARVFYSFPLGILLYRHRGVLAKWAPKWGAWPACLLLVLVLAIPAPLALQGLADTVVVAILLPIVLLFAAAAAPRPATAMVATTLGAISYPLYLIHLPLFAGLDAALQVIDGENIHTVSPLLGLPVVAVIIVLSWLIDRFYDQPIRRWLSARTRAKASSAASATPAAG